MGNLNTKIGNERRENLVSPFSLGVASERGDRLFQFCRQNNCAIMNTCFEMPRMRLYMDSTCNS